MDASPIVAGHVAGFAAAYAALRAAAQVADHWIQTDCQARHKGLPGWAGRRACAAHVTTYVATQLGAVLLVAAVTGLHLSSWRITTGLAISAVTHYWADRRTTLAQLAQLIPGKADFYKLGQPRPGHDDNPSLGTGAYALDSAWHHGWEFIAALVIA